MLIEEYLWYTHGLRAEDLNIVQVRNFRPEEMLPLISTNDLADAYRQCPVSDKDARASIIATWVGDDNSWMFRDTYGSCSGCSSAAISFNRGLLSSSQLLGACSPP